MIQTAEKVKALIRNLAKGDSNKAQILLRNYGMERFLERISISRYKDNFILKGGMLVSSMVGLDSRATMDIDTTVRGVPLSVSEAKAFVEEITSISLDDNVRFRIKDVSTIMDEADYSGVRLSLDALMDRMRIPLKIDISTGDTITPAAVHYRYKLMFEDRYINLWAYNLETVLAEKIETVLSRTVSNTRMRDYYDIYVLQKTALPISEEILAQALLATCHKRESQNLLSHYMVILDEIEQSDTMEDSWENFKNKNSYARGIPWKEALASVRSLCEKCIIQ